MAPPLLALLGAFPYFWMAMAASYVFGVWLGWLPVRHAYAPWVEPGASLDFVRSVLGPMPWTRIMPTGGVDPSENSLREWFGAGIVACGIGSNLITRDLLKARDYPGIEARVRDTIALARRVKRELGR